MVYASILTQTARRAGFLSGMMFLLLALSAAANAQIRSPEVDSDPASGMTRGTNTIEGQVYDSSGRPLAQRCTVRLSSVTVGEFSTLTDDNGLFTFRRLREGTYYLKIEAGQNFQLATETVDFFDNLGRISHVQIQLKPKPAAATKPGVIDATLAAVPKDALELYQKGIQLAEAGKTREAIEKLKAAVWLYPQFVLALNEMSALYVNLGELEPAAEALRSALKIEPNNSTLRLNYGYVLMLKEQFVDSERELHRAVELRGDSVMAHLYRGNVLIRLRNFEEAEKELNRALSLGGKSGIVAYRYLGKLYSERGETAKAIAALENYLKLAPNVKDAEQVRAIIAQLREQSTGKKN